MTWEIRPLKKRLSGIVHSIRFRLSLWFAAILAVVLLVFSTFVYYRQTQDIYNQAAARLAVRLRDLDLAFRSTYRSINENEWLRVPGRSRDSRFVLTEDEVIILSNRSGQIAMSWGPVTRQDAESLVRLISSWKSDQILRKNLSTGQEGDSKAYLFITAPVGSENRLLGWVTMGVPMDPENLLPRLLWTLIFGGLFTLLVALAGGYWLADRALQPVKTVTRTAQVISATDLSRRLNIHTQDELGELAGTFNQMLDRLQAAFDRQRQFTADASHELRTPLTIIGLETGRALSGSRSIEDYQHALEVIQSENESMSRLVGELLTLARMDAGQIQVKLEPLDLSDLALEVLERFAPLAEQKEIQLQAGELPEIPIEGDRQYLLQMIGNLVDNAIKYNTKGPEQWVRVETGIDSNPARPAAWVRVSDNGPGIAPEHIPHLFDRFYRVDSARSRNPGDPETGEIIPGSGLGLSIVQWIAHIHSGEVCVTSEPGKGTIFEARLPLAAG